MRLQSRRCPARESASPATHVSTRLQMHFVHFCAADFFSESMHFCDCFSPRRKHTELKSVWLLLFKAKNKLPCGFPGQICAFPPIPKSANLPRCPPGLQVAQAEALPKACMMEKSAPEASVTSTRVSSAWPNSDTSKPEGSLMACVWGETQMPTRPH